MKREYFAFILGALWMFGIFIIGIFNSNLDGGLYANGFEIFVMIIWLVYIPAFMINRNELFKDKKMQEM